MWGARFVGVRDGQLALSMTIGRPTGDREQPAPMVLSRSKAGDTEAFEALVRQHDELVLRVALRLLGNWEDAKDAAQEVFLRIYRHFDGFDASRPIKPWIYGITVNVCRDLARTRRRREFLARRGTKPAAGKAADHRARLAELKELVEEGLRLLPERERVALTLRDIEGLSTAEVAEVLDISPGTVRSQISRARVKMKCFLDKKRGNLNDL